MFDNDSMLKSAKRGKTERSGIHAWHPYYAGYSEQFVESALTYLNCINQSLVLDPWGGSGTTNLVASRLGVRSVCIDVNPAMSAFAAAKSPQCLEESEKIQQFFENISLNSSTVYEIEYDSGNFLPRSVHSAILEIISAIPFPRNADLTSFGIKSSRINPSYAFCLAVIFISVRRIAGIEKSANPTWLKKELSSSNIKLDNIARELIKVSRSMIKDLEKYFEHIIHDDHNAAMVSDARSMHLPDKCIDRVITSPPYLTRIDYAMSTMPELMILGDSVFLNTIRHNTMGSPVIAKGERFQLPRWGNLCNEILHKIKTHPTKAAATYYWKNITQYFIDADSALQEIYRVLKNDGSGLIVVQSSFFKDVEIPLGEIYVQMARGLGFSAEIVFREEIRGHLAHVNTKSNIYKSGKVYFEDFVRIAK